MVCPYLQQEYNRHCHKLYNVVVVEAERSFSVSFQLSVHLDCIWIVTLKRADYQPFSLNKRRNKHSCWGTSGTFFGFLFKEVCEAYTMKCKLHPPCEQFAFRRNFSWEEQSWIKVKARLLKIVFCGTCGVIYLPSPPLSSPPSPLPSFQSASQPEWL